MEDEVNGAYEVLVKVVVFAKTAAADAQLQSIEFEALRIRDIVQNLLTFSRNAAERCSWARRIILTSVYRMAAGGSPSMEPKLPWPSIKGYRNEKSWASRASEP